MTPTPPPGPLPPPRPGRGRGRRTVHGAVPPLPPPPMAEVVRATDPDPPDLGGPELPPAPPDPGRLTRLEEEELRGVLMEIALREGESLRLFRAMPEQERFFASGASERIVRGGNRGGKTLVAAVEVARAVTGQDPHDKYRKADGVAILVGKDLRHCARVMYKKLFKSEAGNPFKAIRDLETGEWRAYDPSNPDDLRRELSDARPAPPLIPRRFYDEKKISWEDKKEQVPKCIKLKNGWELHFFSSLSAPPQGWNVDIVWFDEEIDCPLWYPEMSARLLDNRQVDQATGKVRGGKFLWSATPQAGTQQLYDLCARAAEQRDDPNRITEEFYLNLLDNTFMSAHAKDEFIRKNAGNEEEYRVRVLGDFALLGMRVYPEFAPKGVHGVPAFAVPGDWTRYCAIDPGRQVCAVLFVAVAPPGKDFIVEGADGERHNLRGRKVIYDELYLKRCDARMLAEALHAKIGQTPIEAWYIDHHAGRATEIASGKTPEQQYSAAFRRLGLACERTKHGFTWGSDNVKAGIEAVRNGLQIVDGRSEWVVMREKCPNFIWEADRYSYKKAHNGVVTDEVVKFNDHLMDTWRYLAMARLQYVKPKPRKHRAGYTNAILKAKREKARKASGWGGSIRLG